MVEADRVVKYMCGLVDFSRLHVRSVTGTVHGSAMSGIFRKLPLIVKLEVKDFKIQDFF